jgi:hypothetical protein
VVAYMRDAVLALCLRRMCTLLVTTAEGKLTPAAAHTLQMLAVLFAVSLYAETPGFNS